MRRARLSTMLCKRTNLDQAMQEEICLQQGRLLLPHALLQNRPRKEGRVRLLMLLCCSGA